jgi:hypothetical protein
MANNNRRPVHNSPIELPPEAMAAAQRMAMDEARQTQQQIHFQMLHQSTMREAFVKFIAADMTEKGLAIAANKAARAASVFMSRLGLSVNIGPDIPVNEQPTVAEDAQGEATSEYTKQ